MRHTIHFLFKPSVGLLFVCNPLLESFCIFVTASRNVGWPLRQCSPVGSGKTALMLALCLALREKYSIAAVTNDIFTREDAEFLTKHKALPASRIRAIETGGCPHAAVREDISANLAALEDLHREFQADILLIESGGDNLAANYSRELADFIIYVIDVSGGDKIPRKGGPGITQSDLLVVNKTDLAEAVGADLDVMERDARKMRDGGEATTTYKSYLHANHP